MSAAALVLQVRTAAGLTQSELARRSGVPRTAINLYERGRREPSVAVLERLAAAAGCEVRIAQIIDPSAAAAALERVLELAESLPHDRVPPMPEPVFARLARGERR